MYLNPQRTLGIRPSLSSAIRTNHICGRGSNTSLWYSFTYFLKEEHPLLRKVVIQLLQLWSSHDLTSLDKILENHPQKFTQMAEEEL